MHLDPFKEISWAFQLHYHICFRTHRRKTVFDDQAKVAALSQALTHLCEINNLHLIEKDCQPEHVQLLLSMRPSQLISDNYWIKVAARRGFAVDQATVLPDHVHLLVRITPKIL